MKKNLERNRTIVKLKEDGMTYEAIGLLYGLSRQRIKQICQQQNKQ